MGKREKEEESYVMLDYWVLQRKWRAQCMMILPLWGLGKGRFLQSYPCFYGGTVFKLESMTSWSHWKAKPSFSPMKVPVVGRRELDLYQLFVEVTSRGGIEQVIRERQLKEVACSLGLPRASTNASLVLRRYYYTLLYNYEQAYFFEADGGNARTTAPVEDSPQIPSEELRGPENVPEVEVASSHRRGKRPVDVQPDAPNPVGDSTSQIPAKELWDLENIPEVEASSSSRRDKSPVEAQPEASSLTLSMRGALVVGVVDAEFSEGYRVTVTIGDEMLKGIILKTREQPSGQLPEPSGTVAHNSGSDPKERRHQQRKKTSKVRKSNPADSTIYRSGYNLFCKEQGAKLKPFYGAKSKEMRAAIDDLWKNLSVDEKAAYQENGLQFEMRYKSEMKEYRERMKLKINDILSEVVPSLGEAALPSSAPEVERDESHPEVEPSPIWKLKEVNPIEI